MELALTAQRRVVLVLLARFALNRVLSGAAGSGESEH